MENTRKYIVIASDENDMEMQGIFGSLSEAQKSVREKFCQVVGINDTELNTWLSETDDAGMGDFYARALDTVSLDGANHDWKIFPIFADGECRLLTEDDEHVISATFVSNMDSGAKFKAPCLVNMKTRQVFDIGDSGEYSDDDSVDYQSVLIPVDDGKDEEEYTVVDLDELMELEQGDELLASLRDVKDNCCWMAAKVNLDDLIKELESKNQ